MNSTDDLVEVPHDVFFSIVGGPQNIHPRSERDHSRWEIVATRQLVGRSEPGYASPHGTPHKYWLVRSFYERRQRMEVEA